MKLNLFRNPAVDPYVSHMRVIYEDDMRKKTEGYWRQKIAIDIQNEINFQAWYNDQHGGMWSEGLIKAKEIALSNIKTKE